jgi:predicted PurR-regulated permease PerM
LAPLVVALAFGVVSVVVWMVVAGLLGRDREILTQLRAGLDEAGAFAGVAEPDTGQAVETLRWLIEPLLAGLLSGLSSATMLIVGIVTGLFILLVLMKDWRQVTDATSDRIAAVLRLPTGVGQQIVSDTVHSFRGYAWGSRSSG